jgi:hypothetical protein
VRVGEDFDGGVQVVLVVVERCLVAECERAVLLRCGLLAGLLGDGLGDGHADGLGLCVGAAGGGGAE